MQKRIIYILPLVLSLLTSCGTLQKLASPSSQYSTSGTAKAGATTSTSKNNNNSSINYSELVRAGRKLGFDLELNDDRVLMTEAASWIGVSYRSGGTDRNGVDCSGLVYAIYCDVYGEYFPRCSSADLYEKYCKTLDASQLRQGDLVFFSTDNSGGKIGHSGIYLKNGKFIHASSSKGVIVSNLTEQYWSKHWYAGGKVK